MFTDRQGVEQFRAEMDDYAANVRTIMTVPLDEVRKAIEDFDREKGGGEVYQRRVRITGKPGDVRPFTLAVRDADTGEEIPNVFKATIYLDALKLNRVEMDSWETDEQGRMITNDAHQIITRKSINELAEVDVTAHEVRRKS